MPKPMFVWSGTAWVSVASEVESLANFATQSYADNTPGARLVVPSSVAVGSGSGSVGTSGAVTFSSASSVSINGCFTSTYDNYRILIRIPTHSTSNGLHNFRMRTSGTDASGSDYFAGGFYNFANSGTVSSNQMNAANTFTVGEAVTTTTGTWYSVELFNPFLSQKTGINSQGWAENTTYSYAGVRLGVHNLTTSYDGFSLTASAGTITGTIRIYGYKN